jgi:polyhydroxyalkanoate synthesis repressor PhaR
MSGPKIVKRYANRKLYDTERSCYVTLDDIAVMIKGGEEVRVVDNKSGEDLTSVTFAQIIFEAEKKKSFMPLGLLRDLIRERGDAVGEFARDRIDDFQKRAGEIRNKTEKTLQDIEGKVAGVMRKGDKGNRGDGEERAETVEEKANILQDLLKSSQRALDDLQKGVEGRVKGPVKEVSRYAHLGKEMDELRKRLASLEQRLEKIS